MSRLRDEEAKKRKLQEENDRLLEIGKEGAEGDRAFKEHVKEIEFKSKVRKDLIVEELDSLKKTYGYHRFLLDILKERLKFNVEFPVGWTHQEAVTQRGLVMELKSPDGQIFRQAFTPAKDPLLDLNAIETFCVRAENTIGKYTHTSEIWTPQNGKR